MPTADTQPPGPVNAVAVGSELTAATNRLPAVLAAGRVRLGFFFLVASVPACTCVIAPACMLERFRYP